MKNIKNYSDVRGKANAYEPISKMIFINRAATKLANLDYIFKFTDTDNNQVVLSLIIVRLYNLQIYVVVLVVLLVFLFYNPN